MVAEVFVVLEEFALGLSLDLTRVCVSVFVVVGGICVLSLLMGGVGIEEVLEVFLRELVRFGGAVSFLTSSSDTHASACLRYMLAIDCCLSKPDSLA